MNLAIITPLFPPDMGGLATYTYELLQRLIERGHQVKVGTLGKPTGSPGVYSIGWVKRPAGNMIWQYLALPGYYVASFISIIRVIKGCDLVYTQNPTIIGLASLLVARLLRKPIMLRYAGDTTWERAFNSQKTTKFLEDFLNCPEGGRRVKWSLLVQKFVLNRVDRIIVPSQFLKDVLIKGYEVKPVKVQVIYNSIDLNDCQISPPQGVQSSGGAQIITVGRLVSHKRIDKVIYAFEELVKEHPQAVLEVIGDGPERQNLEILAQKLHIGEQVEFLGRVTRSETLARLQRADIFVLNSVYEGLPHLVIEAMACRVPVIATNIGGTNEVVKDGETGLLVEVDNDAQLKEKIAILLEDKQLRQRLVDTAHQSVRENFTWEKNLPLLERELQGVASK